MIRFLKNAELNRPDKDKYQELPKIPVWIILDNVRSGLNVGSVFRTADAFLIEGIMLCGITSKPPERDILKSALGATETVTWKYHDHTQNALQELKGSGYELYAVEQGEGAQNLDNLNIDSSTKFGLVFGHEVKGVDPDLIPMLDGIIQVPQSGTKHSLNISVCCGIVIWEFYKHLGIK